MKRKNFLAIWEEGDISPINESQRSEVEEIKSTFARAFAQMKFKKGDRITIDPHFRHIKRGVGDLPAREYGENEVLFKWGPWEFSHIKNWVRNYLQQLGFEEAYHFQSRAPIGAIEFIKK